jgi:hypothetical protein
MVKNPVMLVALNESEHSFYALEWTLNHFFAPNAGHSVKLHVIHARPSPASLLGMGEIGKANLPSHYTFWFGLTSHKDT